MKKLFGAIDPWIEPGPPLGRRIANEGFIHALLRYADFDEFHFFLPTHFPLQTLRQSLNDERVKYFSTLDLAQRLAADAYHCFHCSDLTRAPYLQPVRNHYSKTLFPITCVTHSMHDPGYFLHTLAHCWDGATSRDCIVCSSRAAQKAFNGYHNVVQKHGIAGPFHAYYPYTRIIPFGTDTERFTPAPNSKAAAREQLNIPPDASVILAFGRISPYSKADLIPVVRALNQATLPERTIFIVAGQGSGDDAYADILRARAKNIQLKILSTSDEQQKIALYHASDLFLAPSDNPQETFGMTLVEAMASGLWTIASAYSGYQDVIAEGITGNLIPTSGAVMPFPDLEPLLQSDELTLLVAQSTSVNVDKLSEAVSSFFINAGQRPDHLESCLDRAESAFSWEVVIREYLLLWSELNRKPFDEKTSPGRPFVAPIDSVAQSMCSQKDALADHATIRITALGLSMLQGTEKPVFYHGLESLVDDTVFSRLLSIAKHGERMENVKVRLKEELNLSELHVAWLVLWAIKHGIIETA